MTVHLRAWLDAVQQGVAAASPAAGDFAQHVHVLASTGSTNDDVARAALEGAPQGYTVVAAEQTAGRGRRGASWHSPAAHGLYVSTLLRPDRWRVTRTAPGSAAASLVTLMAGAAVASAIADVCDAAVELKWPNDVMVPASALRASAFAEATADRSEAPLASTWRKLAGILAEGNSDGGVLRSVVLGIGLNVFRSEAPPDVAARMVTLEDLAPDVDRDEPRLVSRLVTALLVRLREGVALLASGDLDEVRRRWRALAPTVEGTPVRVHHQGVSQAGRAAGIDDTGALRVIASSGEVLVVHGGEVEWDLRGVNA